MGGDLDDFLQEVRKESRAAGPEAEAAFRAYDAHFEMAREILELRRQKGLTQVQLAKSSRVQQSEISRIERGLGNPTFQTMTQIAHALGVRLAFVPTVDPGPEKRRVNHATNTSATKKKRVANARPVRASSNQPMAKQSRVKSPPRPSR